MLVNKLEYKTKLNNVPLLQSLPEKLTTDEKHGYVFKLYSHLSCGAV